MLARRTDARVPAGGAPGVGKTQLGYGVLALAVPFLTCLNYHHCLHPHSIQLAVDTCIPPEFGGVAGSTVYIGS